MALWWALVSMLIAIPTSLGLDSKPAATTPRVQSENLLLDTWGLVQLQDQESQQRRAASVAGCMCPPDYHYCGGDHHCYSSETDTSSRAHGSACGAESGASCSESYVEVDGSTGSGCMCPPDYRYCGVDHHCHSSLTDHNSWAHGNACGAEDGILCTESYVHAEHPAAVSGCVCPSDYRYCGHDHWCYSSETDANSWAHGNECGAQNGVSCSASFGASEDVMENASGTSDVEEGSGSGGSGCMCPPDHQYCGIDHHCYSSLTDHSSWAHGNACGAVDGGFCTESHVHPEHPASAGSDGCVCPSDYHYCGPNHWCYSSETDANSWAHGYGCGAENGISCSASHAPLEDSVDERTLTIIRNSTVHLQPWSLHTCLGCLAPSPRLPSPPLASPHLTSPPLASPRLPSRLFSKRVDQFDSLWQ